MEAMRAMHGGPYRIPPVAGCDHARERPGACELCGKPCCSACAEDSVCAFCLLRAFQAVKWKEGARRWGAAGLMTRLSLLAVLSLWMATAAAVHTITGPDRSIPTVEAANPAVTGAVLPPPPPAPARKKGWK